MRFNDTIAAISTPPGRGGIGIVRLSGPQSKGIAETVCRIHFDLHPRTATLGDLLDEEHTVDEVLVTWFPAPHSYTAEDVVEIACHGAPVILRHCLERAMGAGARMAEPGEFTLRAYLNGRIDLPQAEAVRDLIEATTLYQARIAARQSQGSVARNLSPIKSQLLELIALLEAGIDFAEDDTSVAPPAEILRRLDPVIDQISALARSFNYGRLVRDGFTLALVGRPNAGKSSLFNRILGNDRAIVTDIPGTTRDLISESAEFSGIPVRLIDTAGIRESVETIERLGIARSFEAMSDADLTLVVIDGASRRTADDEALIEQARAQGRSLVVANKGDLDSFQCIEGEYRVSAWTGEGLAELRNAVVNEIAPGGALVSEGSFITSVRHASLLGESLAMLRKARDAAAAGLAHELLLLDLYCALQPVDAITGITTADDILNRIFSAFCIGK